MRVACALDDHPSKVSKNKTSLDDEEDCLFVAWRCVMGETIVLVALVLVFIKKINQIRLLHIEWGLFRLEFEPERKKTVKVKTTSLKQPKQIRS
jgi:hypothetical protein